MEREQATPEKPTAEWIKNIPLAEGDKVGKTGEILGVGYAMVERKRHEELELIVDKRIVSHTQRYRSDNLDQDLFVIEKVGRIPRTEKELNEMEKEYLSQGAKNETPRDEVTALLGEKLLEDEKDE